MFKRVIFENWTEWIPELSFWLTFGVFLAIVLRVVVMKRGTIEHLENLPLEDEPRDNLKEKQ
jgi:hypothetical protein